MRSSGGYLRVTLRDLGARRQAACVGASRRTKMQNAHDSAVETQTFGSETQRSRNFRQFPN